MKKLLLIVNPRAGMGKIKNSLLNVIQVLSNAGYEITVKTTNEPLDATKISESADSSYSAIVCCGGDGTLNETISGLLNNKNNFTLGYIPCGTLNEWSTGLHIPKNITKAAKVIADGNSITIDVGKFNNRFFAYTASFGAFTESSYSASQDVKNLLGQVAYLFEGIKSLSNIKPIHLEIETEENTYSGNYIFGAITNSLSVGGVVKFDESKIKMNDGLFEVLLIKKPDNLINLQQIIDAILRKDLENKKNIEFFKASSLKIKSKSKIDWTLDGEHAVSEEDTIIENIQNRITLFLPK